MKYSVPTKTLDEMGLKILLYVSTFLIIKVAAQTSQECPALFMRYTKLHSYCKPNNPTCNILRSTVSEPEIKVILQEHNNYRSKLATGKENNLPPAANMLEMVWDSELAAVAQKHASQCAFEHDCADCRRVQNFGVGQNLAIEMVSNSPNIPNPNWQNAIKSWYDEIAYFSKNFIEKFKPPRGEPTYGHFSQLDWADSWRIGCGYVLYKKNNMYEKLYVCNYGPAGNTVDKSMYKIGSPCSGCPENSNCAATPSAIYPGLCKINGNSAPKYKSEENYIFYCDFNKQPDCDTYVTGPNRWLVYNTLSGNYLGIVLNGGETSTLVLKNRIKPSTEPFCFTIKYRKGPNVSGQADDNTVTETFTTTENFVYSTNLPSYGGYFQQQFTEFGMGLGWLSETEVKITFTVPAGRPEQFFEIQSFYAKDGKCPAY